MRTKIVHGIDDNINIDEWLAKNDKLPDTDPYKLSEDEFCGRWLALAPFCPNDSSDTMENFQPCMNCLYYGEFKTIDANTTNAFGRWEPPIMVCVKCCDNHTSSETVSDDSSPDSIS